MFTLSHVVQVSKMKPSFSCFLVSVSSVFGLAVLSVLKTHPELSTLNYHINQSSTFSNLLSSAENFTFLAPSNSAFDDWFSSSGTTDTTPDIIEAFLTYHLLNGGFPTISFQQEPQFVHTTLTDSSYANVTGGQVVEIMSNNGQAQVVSGNKTVTNIDTLVRIHIERALFHGTDKAN